MNLIAAVIIALILLAAWLIRRDDKAHREARKRNPRPVYPFDEPYGDL